MNKKRIQSTDPARKLALLWGSQRSEGRSGLTLKAILSAAWNSQIMTVWMRSRCE